MGKWNKYYPKGAKCFVCKKHFFRECCHLIRLRAVSIIACDDCCYRVYINYTINPIPEDFNVREEYIE